MVLHLLDLSFLDFSLIKGWARAKRIAKPIGQADVDFWILYPPLSVVARIKRPRAAPKGGRTGPTSGFSGLGLLVGVMEGSVGGLVGARAFLRAADHGAVGGGWVNHRFPPGY